MTFGLVCETPPCDRLPCPRALPHLTPLACGDAWCSDAKPCQLCQVVKVRGINLSVREALRVHSLLQKNTNIHHKLWTYWQVPRRPSFVFFPMAIKKKKYCNDLMHTTNYIVLKKRDYTLDPMEINQIPNPSQLILNEMGERLCSTSFGSEVNRCIWRSR